MGDRLRALDRSDLLRIPEKEGVNELACEFAKSIAYGAVQGPVDGIAQLIDKSTGSKLLPSLHIIDAPEESKFASTKWHVQQIGTAMGMAVPLLALHRSVSQLAAAEFGKTALGQAAIEGTALNKNAFLKSAKDSAMVGALYGGLLCPSNPSEDFASARLKSAASGALTFGSFSAGNSLLNLVAQKTFPNMAEKVVTKVGLSSLAGIPAGVISAQADSHLHGHGSASTDQMLKSAYSFAFVGGALTAANCMLPLVRGAAECKPPIEKDTFKQTEKREQPVEHAEEISAEARALFDRFQQAQNETRILRANTESRSTARRASSQEDISNPVRMSDIWLKDLPADTFDIQGKNRARYWQFLSHRFEKRAISTEISPKRQAETFVQIQRLIKASAQECTTSLAPIRLKQLARETLENVASPRAIDQGDHPTCVLNSIENIIASNHPEKYASLIADLGITGASYKNGFGIELPKKCLVPDKEAREQRRINGNRCFASQLAQYYLANLHWTEGGELPNGDYADPGTVVYQPIHAGKNRAGLYVDGKLLRTNGERVDTGCRVDNIPIEAPEITDNHIAGIFRKVVPRGHIRVIDHIEGIDKFTDENGKRSVTTIRTPDELEQVLLTCKRSSIICGVRSEQLGGPEGWHAVVLRYYDPDTRTVYLDNSWGSQAEYSGKSGENNKITIKRLFELMEPPKEAA